MFTLKNNLIFSIVILAFNFSACSENPPKNINVGDSAPKFSTKTLTGENINFPQDLKNKPTVIRFWADWCTYCAPEMRAMEPVYKEYQSKDLKILSINTGQKLAKITEFVKKLEITYSILLDEDYKISKNYGIVALPTTYFINAQGVIKSKMVGEMNMKIFREELDKITTNSSPENIKK